MVPTAMTRQYYMLLSCFMSHYAGDTQNSPWLDLLLLLKLHSNTAYPELLCSMALMLKIPPCSCFLLSYTWDDCMPQCLLPSLHTLLSCAVQPTPFCQNHCHFSFSLRAVSHSGVSSWRESTLNIWQGAM